MSPRTSCCGNIYANLTKPLKISKKSPLKYVFSILGQFGWQIEKIASFSESIFWNTNAFRRVALPKWKPDKTFIISKKKIFGQNVGKSRGLRGQLLPQFFKNYQKVPIFAPKICLICLLTWLFPENFTTPVLNTFRQPWDIFSGSDFLETRVNHLSWTPVSIYSFVF